MQIFDIVGIGFGPSNLALAIASEEQSNKKVNTHFLESKPYFSWHEDMLLPKATMQISFLKDLVTQNNPCSYYSFLNYVHKKNRLHDFINLKEFCVSRLEFNDYLSWVASHFKEQVSYGSTVIDIKDISNEIIEITYTQNNEIHTIYTKNLVCATGLTPFIPKELCSDSSDVFHNHKFLSKISNYNPNNYYKFAVIGGGQSAAEIVDYISENYPISHIHIINSSFGYKPADDSKFVNEIFSQKNRDYFYSLNDSKKKALLNKHRDTNYAVVDSDLIDSIYKNNYYNNLIGKNQFTFMHLTRVTNINYDDKYVYITTDENQTIQLNCIILATGYTSNFSKNLLKNNLISEEINVNKSYRVINKEILHKKYSVYIQGENESTHGLSDNLLSILAIRSQEIISDILKNSNIKIDNLEEECA